MNKYRRSSGSSKIITLWRHSASENTGVRRCWITSTNIARDKSFVDDLNTERGIVSPRVASVPRSTEIQPSFLQICYQLLQFNKFYSLSSTQTVTSVLEIHDPWSLPRPSHKSPACPFSGVTCMIFDSSEGCSALIVSDECASDRGQKMEWPVKNLCISEKTGAYESVWRVRIGFWDHRHCHFEERPWRPWVSEEHRLFWCA
jgi:hypothetical protein